LLIGRAIFISIVLAGIAILGGRLIKW
jgi:hypothetical protein